MLAPSMTAAEKLDHLKRRRHDYRNEFPGHTPSINQLARYASVKNVLQWSSLSVFMSDLDPSERDSLCVNVREHHGKLPQNWYDIVLAVRETLGPNRPTRNKLATACASKVGVGKTQLNELIEALPPEKEAKLRLQKSHRMLSQRTSAQQSAAGSIPRNIRRIRRTSWYEEPREDPYRNYLQLIYNLKESGRSSRVHSVLDFAAVLQQPVAEVVEVLEQYPDLAHLLALRCRKSAA